MKIGFVTNLRAPYRTLQLNEFSNISNVDITTYYCDNKNNNRNWETGKVIKFKEIDLKRYNFFRQNGYVNKHIIKVVKENDTMILGGYDQPTYILISIVCRLLKKPYILSFDGISVNRLEEKENPIKKFIKGIVINNADYIMGNGTVSKRYFNEVFGYPLDRIYNQYLTVDSNKINDLYKDKERYRKEYRKKLGINEGDKVLIYSGRLIDIKNVDSVIKAISKLGKKDLIFLITGGGKSEKKIINLSEELGVKTIITGFISKQEELFKHYFVGDALILPSLDEPWGLVVNEAMFSGLPVIVSNVCGCSLDLCKDSYNGKIIDPKNIKDMFIKIEEVLYLSDIFKLKKASREIVEEWKFINSKKNFIKILSSLRKK